VESTADLTWALILSAARRVTEGDRLVRAGGFKGWRPDLLIGRDVYGRTLGIVGPGRVGRAVARRARGFNMEVLLAGRRRDQSVEAETDGGFVNLPELLRRSDFVSLHTPLTPETRHLIGPTELGMMKPSAVLVNTSRGPVVDERALAEALKRGTIAAAALDVYEEEPRVRGELLGLENVVLLPHLGSATRRTREAMALMAARNLVEALEGRRPPNMVNPEVWKSPPG
jgi:glyoxylate reductase